MALDIEQELKRITGLAIHYYLEQIKYDTLEVREYAKSMVLAKYGNLLGPKTVKEVVTRSKELINGHQDYFSKRWQVYTEYELFSDEKSYRIDRLMVDDKKKQVVIIDYKSGLTQEEEQLDKYAEIISAKLGADYQIRTEFLEV